MKGLECLVKMLVPVSLLLAFAACELLDQTPPPNIPATVVAEGATVVAEGATVAAEAAAEAKEAVATVIAIVTPEPQRPGSRSVATPQASPTPAPTLPPDPAPTPTPQPSRLTGQQVITADERSETITTLLGQQVDATVSGFADTPVRIDQLVQAINDEERLLGLPYPAPEVTLRHVSEVEGGFCGQNQPIYAPRLEGDPYLMESAVISIRIDDDCTRPFNTIAHEVAHTWFHGNDPAHWIDEGLANAIELQVVAGTQPGEVQYPPVTYCRDYTNIGELEQATPPRSGEDQYGGFSCNYSLGDGIFGALLDHYGDNAFNARVAQLARSPASATRKAHAIEDIRQFLGDDASSLEIINRWYAGQPVMRKYRHLDAVEWTFPPTIDGEYLHLAGTTDQSGVVHDFVPGEDQFCSQFALGKGISDEEWVHDVSPPLQAGRAHHEDSRVVTINHDIDPITGRFHITAKILANALADIRDLSLSVKERVTAGEDGLCNESINFAQIAVSIGQIPAELKVSEHYHLDAIEWIVPPTFRGQTLTFRGRAQPGTIALEWRDGYCGQFSFYEHDGIGYHYIDSLNPFLPGSQNWIGLITGEGSNYHIAEDGTFEATASLPSNALSGYDNLVLVVTTPAAVDPASGRCGASDVLSAIDIQR